ncbi:hypothetical protein LDENG_00142400 [Lucifuga dentata]|nr:hypothetical protein LDENG_00142400 [Lucifuga dentata]
MTPSKFALCLSCLFLGNTIFNLKLCSSAQKERGFLSVNVGDNVSLQCFYEGDFLAKFSWFKQILGQKPRLITTYYKHQENVDFHNEFKDDPRFSLETKNGEKTLKISHLRISDSATYYCASSYSLILEFAEGTTVIVKGSGLNNQGLVRQPASATTRPGNAVTLNCTVQTRTCDEGHSVYWFRSSEESRPGIVYSDGVRNDQCEKKSKTQDQTCIYYLPMNVSDAGTYYCAVVSCGEILFGNGTKLDIEYNENPLVLVYCLSGASVFTNTLAIILAFLVYKMKKRIGCQCKAPSTSNAEGYQDSENLPYVALRETMVSRPRQHRNNPNTECMYSSIRQ